VLLCCVATSGSVCFGTYCCVVWPQVVQCVLGRTAVLCGHKWFSVFWDVLLCCVATSNHTCPHNTSPIIPTTQPTQHQPNHTDHTAHTNCTYQPLHTTAYLQTVSNHFPSNGGPCKRKPEPKTFNNLSAAHTGFRYSKKALVLHKVALHCSTVS
jgi:hypothetical protein